MGGPAPVNGWAGAGWGLFLAGWLCCCGTSVSAPRRCEGSASAGGTGGRQAAPAGVPGMDAPADEMYLAGMDQVAREDIAAAAAVHRELGRDYDDAVAQSLVERISDEIDKRVDARLGRPGDAPARRHRSGEPSRPARASLETVSLALGSMIIGGIISWNVLNDNHGGTGLFAFIWVVIAVINIAYARRR